MKKRQAKKFFKDSSVYLTLYPHHTYFDERAYIYSQGWFDKGFWRDYRKALTRLIKKDSHA